MAAITVEKPHNNRNLVSVIAPNTPDSCWYYNKLVHPNPMLQTPEKGFCLSAQMLLVWKTITKKGDALTGRYKAISYQWHQKSLFRKLVTDGPESLAIIECTIEIGSSVEDTKEMLLNNCA